MQGRLHQIVKSGQTSQNNDRSMRMVMAAVKTPTHKTQLVQQLMEKKSSPSNTQPTVSLLDFLTVALGRQGSLRPARRAWWSVKIFWDSIKPKCHYKDVVCTKLFPRISWSQDLSEIHLTLRKDGGDPEDLSTSTKSLFSLLIIELILWRTLKHTGFFTKKLIHIVLFRSLSQPKWGKK